MKILHALALRAMLFGFFLFLAVVSLFTPGAGRRMLDDAHHAARRRCKITPP